MNFDHVNKPLSARTPQPNSLLSVVSPFAGVPFPNTTHLTQLKVNQTDPPFKDPYELEKHGDTGNPSLSPPSPSTSLTFGNEIVTDLPPTTNEEEDHQIHWDQPLQPLDLGREEAFHSPILNQPQSADSVISPLLTIKLFLVAGPVFMLLVLLLSLQLL